MPCCENPEANFEPSKGRAGAPGAGGKLRKCQSGALLPILALCLSMCSGEFLGEAFLRKLPAQAACDRTDIPFAWRRCCPLGVSRPPFRFCPWEQPRGHIRICLLSAASGSSQGALRPPCQQVQGILLGQWGKLLPPSSQRGFTASAKPPERCPIPAALPRGC